MKLLETLKGITLILFVGLVWLLKELTPFVGWYRILVAILAIFIPNDRLRYYAISIFESSDQDINAIFGGNVDHTISGRVGYLAQTTGKTKWLVIEKIINTLFWFDPNHCRKYIEYDRLEK